MFSSTDGPSLLQSQSTTGIQWASYSSPNPLNFKCKFDGYPVPTIVLSKDGKTIKTVTNSNLLTHSLHTKTIDEFGFYACSARNDFGDETHYIEVAKMGKSVNLVNCSFI